MRIDAQRYDMFIMIHQLHSKSNRDIHQHPLLLHVRASIRLRGVRPSPGLSKMIAHRRPCNAVLCSHGMLCDSSRRSAARRSPLGSPLPRGSPPPPWCLGSCHCCSAPRASSTSPTASRRRSARATPPCLSPRGAAHAPHRSSRKMLFPEPLPWRRRLLPRHLSQAQPRVGRGGDMTCGVACGQRSSPTCQLVALYRS